MTELLNRLQQEAAQLSPEEAALRLPIAVLLGEAVDVVGFCRKYWKAERSPVTNQLLRPGLEMAGEGGPLSPSVIDETSALERLTYEAHRAYMLAVGPGSADDGRARYVLAELNAALEWAFDDDEEDAWDQRLAKLREQHDGATSSQDGLALALEDYASLADEAKPQLSAIPAFDPQLIAEARACASALRERSAPRESEEAGRALATRNRFATLLQRRVQRIRRAARYVFRHHPEIARQAGSAYERRKRSDSRRRAKAATAQPAR